MPRPQTIHYLRENAAERSPHRVFVFDTETYPPDPADPERQVLRLWSARLLRRHGVDPRRPREEAWDGHTAEELADLVASLVRADHALWAFAHNLGFDLAVTALPVLLTARDFRLTESALTTDAPWARLARGSRRLVLADSWGYLPQSVQWLGERLGTPKLALPDWTADDATWFARCRTDVAIVAQALTALMDWWDAGRLGNWSITGPATGWSSFRHRMPRKAFLIDPDPVAREFESRAVTGGRRDVWQVGRRPLGLYTDLDISTAHLTAMSECLLPFRRVRRFDSLPLDDHRLRSSLAGLLAEAEVEVSRPRYPWRTPKGVFYPIGRFRTLLATPELREALARDELRSIGPGYVYTLGEHMAPWARWLASLLDDANPDVPPVVRLTAKHWSRCVPGKWAGRTSEVVERIPDPRPGWGVERGWIVSTGQPADWLRLGGERLTVVRDLWSDDAFPAVLAFIQSYTRVALGRLLDRLGPSVLSCNTDGALVDAARICTPDDLEIGALARSGRDRLRLLDATLQAWAPELAPFQVRIKGAARRVEVISAQHTIIDGALRLAGIPTHAVKLAGGRYAFRQWPKLRVQIERDPAPGYRTRPVTVDLANVAPPGWLMADGTVWPVTVHDPAGSDLDACRDAIVPLESDALAPRWRQHPLLRPLMDPESA